MAIRIGITGGIGSGKSVVAHLLEVMGIPVYISDAEAKRLILDDPGIRQGLTDLLGTAVYLPDGSLNKPLLASYLFASAGHARQVNGIIHPRVRDDFRLWVRQRASLPVVGMESAILVEAGFAEEVDKVVMVYAPLEVRIARAMRRDEASRSQIERRIRGQMDDEAKRGLADFVIINDGRRALIPQIRELLRLVGG